MNDFSIFIVSFLISSSEPYKTQGSKLPCKVLVSPTNFRVSSILIFQSKPNVEQFNAAISGKEASAPLEKTVKGKFGKAATIFSM